jgi:hypothetical protein
VSDQLFEFNAPDDACADVVSEAKYGIIHAIYLAAIGSAMIGWLWLIAWLLAWPALQLI